MPTDWKRADDSELRAHLAAAIAERDEGDDAEGSYSGYELAAIREELRHLNGVDLADRQAAAEVHAAHDRRLDALERRDRP